MAIAFSKIALKAGGDGGAEASYLRTDIKTGELKEEVSIARKAPVHPDFAEAFERLKAHLIHICKLAGQVNPFVELGATENTYLMQVDAQTEVRKISIKETEDGHAVVISGYRELPDLGGFAVNTPKISPNSTYRYAESLQDDIEAVISEAELYFIQGKEAQGKLFGEPNVTGLTPMAELTAPEADGADTDGPEADSEGPEAELTVISRNHTVAA